MKNTPFILLILGIAFIWLGLTGRLGAVLAAIFEPSKLVNIEGPKESPITPSDPSSVFNLPGYYRGGGMYE